eukprot:TRINITY_DN17057_c0_g1_i1.p1 TRINITY_DN17057_c0_g1~~TRINITY_DN17057_c0_g1_i1.p1  ORF type:complete len:150 (+),score=31.18 TRINITY_DN17057_c0_g1_i1:38-451(+)
MPGALQLIQSIKKNNPEIKQGIATSSKSAAVAAKKQHHNALFADMDVVVCGDDPELERGKPDPQIYQLAMRRLGVTDPALCLVFEDALSGVQAGKAAQMHVVAVPDSRMDLEQFAIADQTIASLKLFDYTRWGIKTD